MIRRLLTPGAIAAAAMFAVAQADAGDLPATSYDAFNAEERAFEREIDAASGADAIAAARMKLARFYAAQGLHLEAVAVIDEDSRDGDAEEKRIIVARSLFALGRFEDSLARLAGERLAGAPDAAGLRAMALARLGAFVRASEEFSKIEGPGASLSEFAGEYHLLKSRTALARGDIVAAGTNLDAAKALDGSSAEIDLAAAEVALAAGMAGARARLEALAGGGESAIAARAALALVIADEKSGRISRAAAAAALESIRMMWSGPDFERSVLQATAAFASDADPARALDALRNLAERHPASDAGADAGQRLTGLVSRLATREDIPPRTVARIFYENIDFAPAGSEGDALIRDLAGRLRRLDLLAEAAELLEHQVFKRLRGRERSEIAADLAQIYLDDRRPSEALRVIRSTRIAGLDPAMNERRRLIEATALERAGAPAAALELLVDASDGAALALRAEIQWRARRWPGAAADYRRLAAAAAAPLDAASKAAILRAATAYLLSGDQEGFRSFRQEVEPRLGPLAELDLIDAMPLDTAAGRAGFLNAYRAVFAR